MAGEGSIGVMLNVVGTVGVIGCAVLVLKDSPVFTGVLVAVVVELA